MRSSQISTRIEPKIKESAEVILKRLGINMSEAINIYLNQIILQKRIPFDIRIPNDITIKAMEDAVKDRDLIAYNNVDEMFEDLGIGS